MARGPREGNETLAGVQVQSRLWPEDQAAIEQLARTAGVSVSRFTRWLVRRALHSGLGDATARELRRDLAAEAEE